MPAEPAQTSHAGRQRSKPAWLEEAEAENHEVARTQHRKHAAPKENDDREKNSRRKREDRDDREKSSRRRREEHDGEREKSSRRKRTGFGGPAFVEV